MIVYDANAALPKFNIVPITNTAFLLPNNFTETVQYQVTNQTNLTRTLTMVPIAGITQLTNQAGYCSSQFTLAPQQSCILTLFLDGALISSVISNGPKICKTYGQGNLNPDPFYCSLPSPNDMLAVTPTGTQGQHAYVLNQDTGELILCQVNPVGGRLELCHVTALGFSFPEALAINPAGTYLYVANVTGNSLSVCQVNGTSGELSGCTDSGGTGFIAPDGVALSPDGMILYASNGDNTAGVSACDVTGSGALVACVNNTDVTFSTPGDMTINNSGTQVYVTNLISNTISVCTVSGKTLGHCNNQSETGFDVPEGITLDSGNLFAYIANNGTNNISLCSINQLTGYLNNDCSITDGSFDGFGNIAMDGSGSFAYVPNAGNNKVYVCNANVNSGDLTRCIDSGGSGFHDPSGVLIR